MNTEEEEMNEQETTPPEFIAGPLYAVDTGRPSTNRLADELDILTGRNREPGWLSAERRDKLNGF